MTFQTITEATITIQAPVEKIVHAKMPVFYNPVMKLNRDISILVLNALEKKNMQICDLLAGTGIRSVRLLAELNKDIIKNITINDSNPKSKALIKKNITKNKKQFRSNPEIIITTEDASLLLHNSSGFDYIDIDPFGCPNQFLDAACRRISRGGILAVTATDTSALSGTFPKTCKRKYWATPTLNAQKHENGLRILIRKCQLVAAQYDRALIPIFSYSHEHYMRVFFRAEKGKTKADDIIKQHDMYNETGPMWFGPLFDKKLVTKMKNLAKDIEYEFNHTFLNIIADECKIQTVGFHDIHNICKQNCLEVPKFDNIIDKIKKAGFKVSRTHFTGFGLRSDIGEKELVKIIKKS